MGFPYPVPGMQYEENTSELNCAPPYTPEEQRIIDARHSIIALSGMDPLCMIHNMRLERKSVIMETRKQSTQASDIQVGGNHYKDMDVEPIKAMKAWLTPEEYRGFLRGCIIKYQARANSGKESVEIALGKAAHYQQFLTEFLEEEKRKPVQHHQV